ncbi:ribosomal-protein-alanine acetyltransferase [Vibrio rumoiensis 1S-45]|uniref:Ribosomal-protein-alanine acetyltransferase n=1 Tax=Vibrio rumoiensis 1S-45 TaxID=1188252 RepID=A0A1E5E5P6_9VIBR|nr:ribosomal-protein-alanine acetyltransferase [Vibrio rumoiensis 1S-45]
MLNGGHFDVHGNRVRLIRKGDDILLSHFYNANKQHLASWEPIRSPSFYTQSGWFDRIENIIAMHLRQTGFSFIILNQNESEVLGTVNFSNVSRYPLHACNLGYALAEQIQKQGVMHATLTVLIDWMFQNQNMHRIMAAYIPENIASENVLKKQGFDQEGIAKDYLLINGKWQTHHLMSLTNSQWQPD